MKKMLTEFFCGICREVFTGSEEIYKTHCGHVFHRQCVTDWLSGWSPTCPDCRASCSPSDVMNIIISSRNISDRDLTEENLESKSRLEQATKYFSETQNMLEESEKNFTNLQIQLDTAVTELTCIQFELEQMQIISKNLETELNAKNAENRLHQEDLMKAYEEINKLNILREKEKLKIDYSKELKARDEMIEELNRNVIDKSLELQKEIRNVAKLIVEKMELYQRLTKAKQQRASSTGNVECDQPNTMEAIELSVMLKSLQTQFNKCDLNAGVSDHSCCDNCRNTGAIPKRLDVSCPLRRSARIQSIQRRKDDARSGI